MKNLLLVALVLSLAMCSEKGSELDSAQEDVQVKRTVVKVTLGEELAYEFMSQRDEVVRIETPIELKKLIDELNIEPSTLGDSYGATEDSRFALVLESGVEKETLCFIEKASGFEPYENQLIYLQNGDKLYIGLLAK